MQSVLFCIIFCSKKPLQSSDTEVSNNVLLQKVSIYLQLYIKKNIFIAFAHNVSVNNNIPVFMATSIFH